MSSKNFKVNLAYEKWLLKFITDPSNEILIQMEKDHEQSVNNSNYNPILGA
ncbi:hypothetical protein [Arcobacter peruensis]|uniref:hypothetical protein n=1 Tax=Arcobacter peruensis TaxID=2320140 RepID=UPI0013DFE2DA|nr:hypothetical protein [Arcobacter peruensis]